MCVQSVMIHMLTTLCACACVCINTDLIGGRPVHCITAALRSVVCFLLFEAAVVRHIRRFILCIISMLDYDFLSAFNSFTAETNF